MDYFWKENKKFVIMVGAAFVFLLVYNGFVLSPIKKAANDAATARANKKKELERRMAQGVPTDDALVAGRRDRDQNNKMLASMKPEVGFTLAERFTKPKNEKFKSYYDNEKLGLISAMQKKAIEGKVAFPKDVGLPDEVTEEMAVEVLSRLAVVDRLVTLAVDAEVEKIDSLDGQYLMERDERSSKKSQFLTKYSGFIKVTGKQESIFRMVHGAQKKGSYLAVTHLEMSRPDPTKDLFEAQIGVALLRVDDKGALDAK